jgi:hypothetical protein
MRGVGEAKHTTRGDPVASKTKTIFGPLSETGMADRVTPKSALDRNARSAAAADGPLSRNGQIDRGSDDFRQSQPHGA